MTKHFGETPPGRNPDEYDRLRRRILWMLPTGLYVLGTRAGSRRNLMTISWVTQVATEPKLLGVGVEHSAVTHELLSEGAVFSLSILSRSERALVRKFAKPVKDQSFADSKGAGLMNGEAVRREVTGAPILDVAIAWIDCELRHTLDLGSHSWFVGEVMACGLSDEAGSDTAGVLRMEDTRMSYGG